MPNKGGEMFTVRNLMMLATAIALSVGAQSAQAGKGKKKKGDRHLHGVVTEVHKEKDGSGTFTIKTKSKAKNADGAKNVVEQMHKFTFNAATKFEFVKDKEHKPAAASDLHEGEHVGVAEKQGRADVVAIHQKAKAKNKAKKKT